MLSDLKKSGNHFESLSSLQTKINVHVSNVTVE